MKIGILTLFHDNYNWGGVLQGYALKTLLERRYSDANVDILIYKNGRNVIYTNRLKQAFQYSPKDIIKKVTAHIAKKNNDKCSNYLEERKKLFKNFMKEYTTNATVYNDDTLVEAAEEYDCLISGSDQVWNPNVGQAGYFQTMISSEQCRKIAYAASIARDDLSRYERKRMIPYIDDFDAISVREKTAKVFLEKYLGKESCVEEVLDPVLMLTQEEWITMALKSKIHHEGKYAVAFFFSDSLEYRKQIKMYCEEKKIKLYFIAFARNEYESSDLMGYGEKIFDVGPYEFIDLFLNAQCVFTDSFHGCIFSLIFHKNMCVFERDINNKVSKNSRLYDLLNKFYLSERMISKNSDIQKVMDKNIDFDKIEILKNSYREKSLQFLDKQFKDIQWI